MSSLREALVDSPNPLQLDVAQSVDEHDINKQTREFFNIAKTPIKSMFSRISGLQFRFRAGGEKRI